MKRRFAEELLLLVLNEDYGGLSLVPDSHLNPALAGAVLMDLALERRIETDLQELTLVDAAPLDDDLLDPALEEIAALAAAGETRDAGWWVRRLAEGGPEIRDRALARLLRAGILSSADAGEAALAPGVSRSRRYPAVDAEPEQEIRLRIMRILFSDDIPDPRDIVIIALADACRLFEKILTKAELREAAERLSVVRRLDLIGRAVAAAVRESARAPAAPAAPAREIPEVPGWPLLGSAPDAARDMRAFLARCYREHGPVFRIRILNRRILVLAGLEANRFLAQRGKLHLRSYEPWRGFAHDLDAARTMLSMDGKDHVRLRQAFGAGMSPRALENHLEGAAAIARSHFDSLPLDRPFRPGRVFRSIVADQMGEVLAGAPAGAYLDDLVLVLDTLLRAAIMKQRPLFGFGRRFRRARARLGVLAQRTLEAHRPGGPLEGAGDLVNEVLDLHAADPLLLPETDIEAMVLAPYLAGIETVGNTLALTLYGVLKHPHLIEGMRAELDPFFAGGPPTTEGLRRLALTHRVVMESLRMYPAAPVVFRFVGTSFDFAGYRIPAGNPLFVAATVTHRLPECFPDPDRFDPDRYLPERAEHRQRHAYVPFGIGAHHCLGAGFAEVETLLTLAVLLHRADLVMVPPDYELRMSNVPTPRPAKDFRVRLTRRR